MKSEFGFAKGNPFRKEQARGLQYSRKVGARQCMEMKS
jgi:hypothetical protein